MRCAIFQTNSDFLVIYQNIQRLDIFPSFRKKMALSIANVFRNIQFLPCLPLLLRVSEVCNISNKYIFLINHLNKCFYTRHLALFLRFKTNLRSLSQKLLDTSTFYHIFTNFHSG